MQLLLQDHNQQQLRKKIENKPEFLSKAAKSKIL